MPPSSRAWRNWHGQTITHGASDTREQTIDARFPLPAKPQSDLPPGSAHSYPVRGFLRLAWRGAGLLFGLAVMFIYFLLLSVFMSAVGGIFNAALYRYACFKQAPPAFSQELIASAWAPKT